jgi:hypothetical protein
MDRSFLGHLPARSDLNARTTLVVAVSGGRYQRLPAEAFGTSRDRFLRLPPFSGLGRCLPGSRLHKELGHGNVFCIARHPNQHSWALPPRISEALISEFILPPHGARRFMVVSQSGTPRNAGAIRADCDEQAGTHRLKIGSIYSSIPKK